MNPYLNTAHHPKVKIAVFLSSWIAVECYIDTGFSGGLTLPMKYKRMFGEKSVAIQEYQLANGSTVKDEVYICQVRYKNHNKRLSLIFTKSPDALVGIEFLKGLVLKLNLKTFSVSLE